MAVQRVKIRDRGATGAADRIRFSSAILPKWARRTPQPRCAAAGPLPARGLDRRLPGGACGAARQGRPEPVAVGDRPADGRMAGRVRALAGARSLGPALRLRLGRWRLPAGPHGGSGRMHAGADRRDAGGPEGARRLPGRSPGERSELARAAGRREAARARRSRPRSRSATARSASGRRSTRSIPARATSAAGCTRPPTCSTRCRNPSRRR